VGLAVMTPSCPAYDLGVFTFAYSLAIFARRASAALQQEVARRIFIVKSITFKKVFGPKPPPR
jgi:hypothetical protein